MGRAFRMTILFRRSPLSRIPPLLALAFLAPAIAPAAAQGPTAEAPRRFPVPGAPGAELLAVRPLAVDRPLPVDRPQDTSGRFAPVIGGAVVGEGAGLVLLIVASSRAGVPLFNHPSAVAVLALGAAGGAMVGAHASGQRAAPLATAGGTIALTLPFVALLHVTSGGSGAGLSLASFIAPVIGAAIGNGFGNRPP